MPGKSPGSSIKWPELYEKLIAQGKSKEEAARISNSAWAKKSAKKLKKHTPGGQEHDQSTHGDWSQGTSGRQLHERIKEQGGLTIDPITGNVPDRGIPVAFKKFEEIHPSASPRIIRDYLRKNMGEFRKGFQFGAWYDDETDELFLDVVEVFDGDDYIAAFDAAAERGQSETQLAIFDLKNFQEIRMTPGDIGAYRARLSPDGTLRGT